MNCRIAQMNNRPISSRVTGQSIKKRGSRGRSPLFSFPLPAGEGQGVRHKRKCPQSTVFLHKIPADTFLIFSTGNPERKKRTGEKSRITERIKEKTGYRLKKIRKTY